MNLWFGSFVLLQTLDQIILFFDLFVFSFYLSLQLLHLKLEVIIFLLGLGEFVFELLESLVLLLNRINAHVIQVIGFDAIGSA